MSSATTSGAAGSRFGPDLMLGRRRTSKRSDPGLLLLQSFPLPAEVPHILAQRPCMSRSFMTPVLLISHSGP